MSEERIASLAKVVGFVYEQTKDSRIKAFLTKVIFLLACSRDDSIDGLIKNYKEGKKI